MDGVRGFAPDARWVKPESLHITLKFIGEQPDAAVERIKIELSQIELNMIDLNELELNEVTSSGIEIHFRGYGFFPTAKSARVFWVGMEAGPGLASLAAAIDEKTAALGIPKEERAFSPHLTLARAGGGSGSPRQRKEDGPNRSFQHLQEKLAALSTGEFGTMTAREFFLYQSQLSPKGSTYTKLARFALTGSQS